MRGDNTLRAVSRHDRVSPRDSAKNNRRQEILKLSELSAALAGAADALELVGHLDIRVGLDFHTEVRRFEITLITQALKHTGGSQIMAANLLRLKPTTLHSKIKSYDIPIPSGPLANSGSTA